MTFAWWAIPVGFVLGKLLGLFTGSEARKRRAQRERTRCDGEHREPPCDDDDCWQRDPAVIAAGVIHIATFRCGHEGCDEPRQHIHDFNDDRIVEDEP